MKKEKYGHLSGAIIGACMYIIRFNLSTRNFLLYNVFILATKVWFFNCISNSKNHLNIFRPSMEKFYKLVLESFYISSDVCAWYIISVRLYAMTLSVSCLASETERYASVNTNHKSNSSTILSYVYDASRVLIVFPLTVSLKHVYKNVRMKTTKL